MSDSDPIITALYDSLASEYDLYCEDWDDEIASARAVLGTLLRHVLGHAPTAILDCSCGIGTQTIALALEGYAVTGSDLSSKAIERARAETKKRGLEIRYYISAFDSLVEAVPGTYDAVISCDNAVPHLMSEQAVVAALEAMYTKLAPGGVLLLTTRDYDKILAERPSTSEVDFFQDAEGSTRVSFQRWYWSPDGETYDYELFLIRHKDGKSSLRHNIGHYRPLTRSHLSSLLQQVGFESVAWHMPEPNSYFQPVVTSRRPRWR